MNYNRVKLGEVAYIEVGYAFKSSTFNTESLGYKLIRGKNIGKGYLHWGKDTMCYENINDIPEKYKMQLNDIVLSMDGNVVQNKSIVRKKDLPSFLVQRVARLRAKKDVDQLFLWYLVNSYEFEKYIDGIKTGTTIQHISSQQISNFEFDIPDYNSQRKISKILSSIDKKIDLNDEMNDTLFTMLKTVFRHDLCSNDNNKKSISNLIEDTVGGDWGKAEPEGNNNVKVYCVRGADIPNMEYGNKGNAPVRFILEKNYINKKLESDNIIIEISGGSPTQSTGRTAYITQDILNMYDSPILCTNFCRAIKVKNKKYAPFVYMTLKTMYDDNIFFNWENGTTGIKNLALKDMLFNTEVSIPTEEENEKFYDLFNKIMSQISTNSQQNQLLEEMRKALLPKLLNDYIDLENV